MRAVPVRVERSKSSESLGTAAGSSRPVAVTSSAVDPVLDRSHKVCKYVEGAAMFFTECECESQTCLTSAKQTAESGAQEKAKDQSSSTTANVLPGVVSQEEKVVET